MWVGGRSLVVACVWVGVARGWGMDPLEEYIIFPLTTYAKFLQFFIPRQKPLYFSHSPRYNSHMNSTLPANISPQQPVATPRLRKDLRKSVEDVFEDLGGADGLVNWVKESTVNKRIFYKDILTKVIPRQLTGEITGAGGGPVKMVVEWQGPTVIMPEQNAAPAEIVMDMVTEMMDDPSME